MIFVSQSCPAKVSYNFWKINSKSLSSIRAPFRQKLHRALASGRAKQVVSILHLTRTPCRAIMPKNPWHFLIRNISTITGHLSHLRFKNGMLLTCWPVDSARWWAWNTQRRRHLQRINTIPPSRVSATTVRLGDQETAEAPGLSLTNLKQRAINQPFSSDMPYPLGFNIAFRSLKPSATLGATKPCIRHLLHRRKGCVGTAAPRRCRSVAPGLLLRHRCLAPERNEHLDLVRDMCFRICLYYLRAYLGGSTYVCI